MVNWAELRQSARRAVHDAFRYPADLSLSPGSTVELAVRWRRKGAVVGEDEYTQAVLTEHQLVFDLEELGSTSLRRGMRIQVRAGTEVVRFELARFYPPDGSFQTVGVIER